MSSPSRRPRAFGAVRTCFSRGRRLALLSVPAALAATLATSNASAQDKGFTANRYEPAESGSDWFENDSLDMRGKLRPALGIVAEYAKDNVDLISRSDGSVLQRLVADQIYVHLNASLVLWDRLRLGLSLPLALYQYGFAKEGVGSPAPPDAAAVGDLRVGADLRLYGEYGDPFSIAIGGQVWLPTGPTDQYAGDGLVRGAPHILVAGDLLDFAYAARIGYEIRGLKGTFEGVQFGNEVTGGLAAGLRIVDKKLLIGPELSFSTLSTNAFKSLTTPAEVLFGAHYKTGDFRISGGVGAALSEAFGSPAFRAILGLDWSPAIEKPKAVVADRDGDGVPDSEDACPDVPGIKTDDPKTNGCPMAGPPLPPDSDHDGVFDMDDACPDTPGIKTDDPKTNGCPGDRDHDGIHDNVDACPDVPGVKTEDPKTNGCPPADPDRDKDGILNDVDACPDEAGPPNADPKKNGCPLAFVSQGQIKITEQVKFEVGSARILKDSDTLMNAVLKILTDHPEIKLVRIEGHTDNTGSAALNKTLSGQRAASVVAWLVLHGVDKTRLASEGFGSERPIDTNATTEGKANNRRVEFHIDKSDAAPSGAPPAQPATTKKP
jgi:OOP family OmpA-OmpF porin